MKQTAVEWLVANIDWQLLRNTKTHYNMIVEKAKENEKQQHKQTWFESTSQFANEAEMLYKKDFEQYYNETFNK